MYLLSCNVPVTLTNVPFILLLEVHAHTSTDAARKKAILWRKMANNKQSLMLPSKEDTCAVININRSQQQMDEMNKHVVVVGVQV